MIGIEADVWISIHLVRTEMEDFFQNRLLDYIKFGSLPKLNKAHQTMLNRLKRVHTITELVFKLLSEFSTKRDR